MELFEAEFLGYHRISKKWARLINVVRSSKEQYPHCCVSVSKKYMSITDGGQAMRIEYGPDTPIKPGDYFMTKERILVPVLAKHDTSFPKMDDMFAKKRFNKTAAIELNDSPLLAMACAIAEFNSTISLDLLGETFEAIADLDPDYVRLFGYSDERAKEEYVMLEFMAEDVQVNYIFKPLNFTRKDFVNVDEQPCLFDIKKAS